MIKEISIKNKRIVEDISTFNYGFSRLITDLQLYCNQDDE
jgi:hypothetical protein